MKGRWRGDGAWPPWAARLLAVTSCAAALLSGQQRLAAQSRIYCTVSKVESAALSNATQITITGDGILQTEFDSFRYYTEQAGNRVPKRMKVIPFRIPNARTTLGSFVQVGLYPVSHVQFGIPRESRDGVGLDVSVVLYRAAAFTHLETRDTHFGARGSGVEQPSFGINQSRDGRSLILKVKSDRYREAEVTREAAAAEKTQLTVTPEPEGRVTIHALNSPLGDVLRAISESDGMQLLMRGGANYRASMILRRLTPDEAVRVIARGYGLSVRRVEGVYYVTEGLPTEVDSYWATPTVTLPLRNISPDLALDLLPDFLLQYVHVNAEQNALVAAGPPQLLDKIEADLRVIDQTPPQIELSAMLVEERADGGLDLASEIAFASGVHEFGAVGDTGRLSYRIAHQSLSDLRVKLRALEARGLVHTRVCASTTVRSGSWAELFVGREQYFTFLTTTRSGEQEVMLTSTAVGTHIWTEPWTGDGHSITVPIWVQANTVASVDDEGRPLVATRQLWGTLRIQSGETLVFGGLATDMSERRHSRAGGRQAPLIGDLAQVRRRGHERNEVLVLLSARAYLDTQQARQPPQPM